MNDSDETANAASLSFSPNGIVFGAGMEYAFTDNILARIEYRYADYGKYRYNSVTAFPGLTGQQEPKLNTLRAGVAYKF